MAKSRPAGGMRAKHSRAAAPHQRRAAPRKGVHPHAGGAAAVLEQARRAGLLDGERTEHVSFRAPSALVKAAKRESGVKSPTELGILALATLAQPDPVAAFMRRTRGRLGQSHSLEY
jgi:hypothetical protein